MYADGVAFQHLRLLTINGGNGNDMLVGSPFVDRIDGGAGNDELTGGAGIDTFADSSGSDTLVEARNVSFTLSNTQFAVTGTSEVEQFGGIFESARLYGYKLNGDGVPPQTRSGINTFDLSGWTGNATLFGGEGDDVYRVSANVARGVSSNITINDTGSTAGQRDHLTITTSNEDETIFFLPDQVTVYAYNAARGEARPANPSFTFLFGAAGALNIEQLTVNGGGGSDTLIADERINQWNITGQNAGTLLSTGIGISLGFENVENLLGNSKSDTFHFATAGSISGWLDGKGLVTGDALADWDRLDYADYNSAVTVNRQLTKATAIGQTYRNIERLIGGSQSDTLIGEDLPNAWHVTGKNAGTIEAAGGTPILSFEGVENLTGGLQRDVFYIDPLRGVDGVIDGQGDATDLLDYSDQRQTFSTATGWTTPVIVHLGNETVDGRPNTSSTGGVKNVEDVSGGSAADQIFGNASANRLLGGAGNDKISGGPGADSIDGQTGNDVLNGDDGNDFIIGSFGDDTLDGGLGQDVLFGGFAVGAATDYDRSQPLNFELPLDWIITESTYSSSEGSNFGRLPTLADPLNSASRYNPQLITPVIVAGLSIDGAVNDGADILVGGPENDILFGGSDSDKLYGDAVAELDANGAIIVVATELATDGKDYIDAGAGADLTVLGGGGDDVIRGGDNDDNLDGGSGIDQLYGDGGDDSLFGGAGHANGRQAGQRLFGGPGRDSLYAFAPTIDFDTETPLAGDQLFGGDDGDFLRGNIRRELIVGGAGNEFIAGDILRGPDLLPNTQADTTGADDRIFGDSGEDQLFGGGGNDFRLGWCRHGHDRWPGWLRHHVWRQRHRLVRNANQAGQRQSRTRRIAC